MDYLRAFSISAAGMDVERTRVEVASMNLANASTVQDPAGASYQPLRAAVRTVSAVKFGRLVDNGMELALPTVTIESAGAAPRLVLDPGHPLANAQGFVAYPGVDTAGEMLTMMSATRAYEANVAAMNTARTLALKTLEIGRNT